MSFELPGQIRNAYEETLKRYKDDEQNGEDAGDSGNEEPRVADDPASSGDDTQSHQPPQMESEGEWERRFKGYKAATDTTIHELRQEAARLQADRAAWNVERETIQAQLDELKRTVPPNYVPSGVLSQEDIELLGEDNAQRIAKIAHAQVERERKKMEAQLGAVVQRQNERDRVEAQQAAASQDKQYWDSVARLVPDVRQIDLDPKFAEFLNSIDEDSGRYWRHLGQAAKGAWDVRRMADIYSAFKGTLKPASREAEVVPRGAGGSSVPVGTQGSGKIWTRKEFENAVASQYRGGPVTQERMKRIEDLQLEYQKAYREGRVRG